MGGESNEAVEETCIQTLSAVYLHAKEAMDPAGLGLVGYGVRTVSCSGSSRHLAPGLVDEMVRWMIEVMRAGLVARRSSESCKRAQAWTGESGEYRER